MSANTSTTSTAPATDIGPRLRGKNELLAIDVAMAIFRRCGIPAWSQLVQDRDLRAAILADLEANYSDTVVARIAASNTGLPVQLEGGYQRVGTWLRQLAASVVFEIIHDIVGIIPVYGEQPREWIFLGRTIGLPGQLAHTPILPGLTIDEDTELADLWVSEDGREVAVVGSHKTHLRSWVDSDSTNSHIREATRRSRMVGLPVREACPEISSKDLRRQGRHRYHTL